MNGLGSMLLGVAAATPRVVQRLRGRLRAGLAPGEGSSFCSRTGAGSTAERGAP
jgi:hypothetical protein